MREATLAIRFPFCLRALGILALGLILLTGLARAETPLVSKTFPYGNANVDDLKEALPQVLSARGKFYLVESTRKIVVQDEPSNLEAAEAIIVELSKVAVNARNVRVEVTWQEIGGTSERRVSGSGTIHVDPVEKNAFQVSANDRSTASDQMAKQFIVVQSGRAATLQVGEEVPMVDYFYQQALDGGYIQSGTVRWQNIGTQLLVCPRIVGNKIELSITPEITTLVDARKQVVSFARLATTVTLADGAMIQLGGFDGASAEFNKGFFTRGGKSGVRVANFTLRAYIEAAGITDR